MFSRIVITGDVLRPFQIGSEWESATWKNIRWLHAILKPALQDTGLPLSTLAWDDQALPGVCRYFDTPLVYHQLGTTSLSLEAWAQLARQTKAPPELVEALRDPLGGALVIGYEMPDVLLDALRQLGCPFVDVILHPLRFMPDLVFALRTNVPAYHQALLTHRLPTQAVAQQAGLIQAKAAWMAKPAQLPPGSVLVLGQVANDRAMVKPDGTFASLDEHIDRLHQLCFQYPCVLFKPHPYEAAGTGARAAVVQLPVIIETQANFYHLLAQPEIEGVVALNSSGLFEAKAFGRWSDNLLPFLYDFESDHAPDAGAVGAPIALTPDWIDPGFWHALLSGASARPVVPCAASSAWTPNRLRRSMNADWGYGFIEKVIA